MKRSDIQNLLHAQYVLLFAVLLCISGCAAQRLGSGKIDELNTINQELQADPNPQVNMTEVERAAVSFPEEDESLSAMTSEKFTKKLKLACLKLVHLEPNEEIALASFARGVELFDHGDFDAAAKELWTAYFRWPDSPLQEDAIFLRAESYFFANRYAKAQREYERLLKKYDSSRYLDRVSPRLFAIAQYWEKLDQINHYNSLVPNFSDKTRPVFGTFGNSVKAYKTIYMHDPNGLWAEHALMAAGNANYIRGEYFDAADFYDDLIKNYPQSKHLLPACELNLSSKLLMYQGPEYDGSALEEADVLATRLLTQFGPQLGERRKDVLETKNRIVDANAQRDMTVAEFYETKRLYGAARYYYLLVINDYPQTSAAAKAKERYDVILNYRAEPPDYFSWLNKIFPETYN